MFSISFIQSPPTLSLFIRCSNNKTKMMTTIRSSKPLLYSSSSFSSLQQRSSSSSFSTPRNFIHFPSIKYNNNHKRMLTSAISHASPLNHQVVQGQVGDSFLRNVLSSIEHVYLNRNPTAKAILDLTANHQNQSICYDHLAFRTFGVNGHGIESMSKLFLDFGYTQMEELTFPKKKLRALWFSPPTSPNSGGEGSGVHGPLPRIFISELLVHQMSPQAQEIIQKYVGLSSATAGHERSALASALGCLTWPKPSHSEFQQLARESEYAAWTLVNGYTLNHVTISTHRLEPPLNDINNFNRFVQDNGFKLNSEGDVLKVSPDGLLLQSSTVADSIPFQFSDGITESVPCSYIEFAQRLVLPQYKHLPQHEVEEVHRRDGFEVGNADKIFESTSKDQLTRKV